MITNSDLSFRNIFESQITNSVLGLGLENIFESQITNSDLSLRNIFESMITNSVLGLENIFVTTDLDYSK